MLESTISLLSIFLSVCSANIATYILERKPITAISSITAVFGSVLFMKSFSNFGFSPQFIVHEDDINYIAFTFNIVFSILSGMCTAILVHKLKKRNNSF